MKITRNSGAIRITLDETGKMRIKSLIHEDLQLWVFDFYREGSHLETRYVKSSEGGWDIREVHEFIMREFPNASEIATWDFLRMLE